MSHFLIVLRRVAGDPDEALERDHATFIDGLIARRLVLLGGGFPDRPRELYGAYAVKAENADEAGTLAAGDPLVRAGVVTFEVLRWNLVAVDPGAVDASLLVPPERG